MLYFLGSTVCDDEEFATEFAGLARDCILFTLVHLGMISPNSLASASEIIRFLA